MKFFFVQISFLHKIKFLIFDTITHLFYESLLFLNIENISLLNLTFDGKGVILGTNLLFFIGHFTYYTLVENLFIDLSHLWFRTRKISSKVVKVWLRIAKISKKHQWPMDLQKLIVKFAET